MAPSEIRSTPPVARMTLGVVAEHRESHHAWATATWRPTAVIAGGGPDDAPRLLDRAPGVARWYLGRVAVELFPRETPGYLENLASGRPQVFVVLRRRGDAAGVMPFLATVCPFEAQGYLDSGEDVVEGVAMPPALVAWIEAFVARHLLDEPFVKRRQKPKREVAEADPFRREPPVARGRDGGDRGR